MRVHDTAGQAKVAGDAQAHLPASPPAAGSVGVVCSQHLVLLWPFDHLCMGGTS
jgi:hypothetical protein